MEKRNDAQRKEEDTIEKKYLFILSEPSPENRKNAYSFLKELGIRITSQEGDVSMIGYSTEDLIDQAIESKFFSGIYSRAIKEEHLEKFSKEQQDTIELWNFSFTEEYKKVRDDLTHVGKKWSDPDLKEPMPHSRYDPDEFKTKIQEFLDKDDNTIKKEYEEKAKNFPELVGKEFIEYERKLADIGKNETAAYYIARIAIRLDPEYQVLLLEEEILADFIKKYFDFFFQEKDCWKLENEISVGVVFVESSRAGEPTFNTTDRLTLRQEILDGLTWIANYESKANLSWVFDWQYVNIDVADGTSSEDYWRNPGIAAINYHGNTYTGDLDGLNDYREDMRTRNFSSHAVVIFVTPFNSSWFAYATESLHKIVLAEESNWGGWGISNINRITVHEMCHLFGASDEYTGTGTPCSSCGGQFGCYKIPNGNCGTCASPQQECIMDENYLRMCAYTQAHVGWADLFVELRTADVIFAGTDDTVWLDIGERTFKLDTKNHNDRERGNVEGYALNYTGVISNQIKRIGIRKSPDGLFGGWKLKRIRVWHLGDLICDCVVNKWLEDNERWWVSDTCGTRQNIVNKVKVRITTADVLWAGTDDNVYFHFGGRRRELDNPWRNDFERDRTDSFNLDPGTGLSPSEITTIKIHKSPDGLAGGWKLKGVKLIINDATVYNKQNINKWLEDDNRTWQDNV